MAAYEFRVIESYFDGRFKAFTNSLWLALITMATIGYGDMTPNTIPGILIGIVLSLCGILIVSLFVASLRNLFSLSQRQKISLTLLKRLKAKGELKDISGKFIALCLERLWIQRKTRKFQKISFKEKKYSRQFSEKRFILKNNKSKQFNLYQDMTNQFQFVKLHLGQIQQNFLNQIHELSDIQSHSLCRSSNNLNQQSMKLIKNFCSSKLQSHKQRFSYFRTSIMNNLLHQSKQVFKEINQLQQNVQDQKQPQSKYAFASVSPDSTSHPSLALFPQNLQNSSKSQQNQKDLKSYQMPDAK